MENYSTLIYVIADEVLRILQYVDDPQSKMSNAEVITFAITSARFFSGNHKLTRYLCTQLNLFPNILSNSRINRRIRQIPWFCWEAIFRFLSLISNQSKKVRYFAVDSFPVSSCQKNRIDRRMRFTEPCYIGFAASKKKYFCGIKVHMVVTNEGFPIEAHFKPGSESDLSVLWKMNLDIPSDSTLYADGAYNCFDLENERIHLLAKRGAKAKNRIRPESIEKNISSKRQIIETAFSCITRLFPREIKSRTESGFLIKIFCFILAYSASFLCKDPFA